MVKRIGIAFFAVVLLSLFAWDTKTPFRGAEVGPYWNLRLTTYTGF